MDSLEEHFPTHSIVFSDTRIEQMTAITIAQHTAGNEYVEPGQHIYITPVRLILHEGTFTRPHAVVDNPFVTVVQSDRHVIVHCDCGSKLHQLCDHAALVLTAIISNEAFGCFFNDRLRLHKLQKFAKDYGLEHRPDLDKFFAIGYEHKKLVISPRQSTLIPVTAESLQAMNALIHTGTPALPKTAGTDRITIVVLKQHKFYRYLLVELYQGEMAKNGKIKNPLTPVAPLDFTWQSDDPDHIKFFTAVHKFQAHADGKRNEADIKALRAIVKNPSGYPFYYHVPEISENVTAASIEPVKVALFHGKIGLTVDTNHDFFELGGTLTLHEQVYALKDIVLKFSYFFFIEDTLYLIDQLLVPGIIDLLKNRPGNLQVHATKFRAFKEQLLDKLEEKLAIDYTFIQPATPVQLEQQGFNEEATQLLYLSDMPNYVMIIPVMRYGDVEIPIRTKKQIYSKDDKGKDFLVERDGKAESHFMGLLIRQHPYFAEQLDNELHYFYLHRKHFLAEEWFLPAFEIWKEKGIAVYGFNELEGNKLNPHRIKVDLKVMSGINWFNVEVNARFGKKSASLKQIYKAIRDKSKYVALDDGTQGILPQEWMEKFARYFDAGEVIDLKNIQIAKVNFRVIDQLFEQEVLDKQVDEELAIYRQKIHDFEAIKEVPVPVGLLATLRPYQQTGVNWLNFLDDFNFGGCLADDMGLGKSMQVIAFILLQRTKVKQNTNIIVVPATLIFNWQAEIARFAPSIKVLTIYGASRMRDTSAFDNFEVILTSYGTLLSDIELLRTYAFNYAFLDESQNIKNPETQRYKAVCLLQARNRIAVTGTPIENNTYDLYSQLSFACPGLLGSKRYFREVYAIPIDMFKSSKRARELQRTIEPFVLRRTKQQVAAELPEKTEMILYCEMGDEQRRLYDAQEKEFREQISATSGDELKKHQLNVLKGLTRLRQICDAPALLGDDKYSRADAAKIDLLMEQIEEKSPVHKILVFSQFVSMLNLIRLELVEKGIGFSYLTGGTKNRQAAVDVFQEDPNCRVFLISLKVGGTGLNLTAADYVYLVDPWWNPAVENQAIDRAHRIGQDKKVIAVRMICKNTLEEKMLTMQANKKELSDELIRTDGTLLRSLEKKDLLHLLSHEAGSAPVAPIDSRNDHATNA